MKQTLIALMIVSALAAGCSQSETSTAGTGPTYEGLTAEELGVVGAEIRRSPERAEQILSERELDEKRFEAAIRKVAADPDASQRYRTAFQEAGGAAAAR